ncbi:hypothetical protein Leryth_011633 [Lithospermum erythrorhizon]|nr:hypothetical protein Leryth_011633 [Lithospermum erythrorhizon]
MTSSRDQTEGTCFSGIVSRLLCTRSLPTHPTSSPENDQITPKPKHQSFKDLISNQHISSKPSNEQQDVGKETIMPGVVARLMGLETMPPKDGNLGSYLRSRSVNFVDYLYSFDDLKPQHRRIKTSLSFREVPTNFDKGNALEKEKGQYAPIPLRRLPPKWCKGGSDSIGRGSNNKLVKQRKVDKNEEHARNGGNFLKKKQSRISEEPQKKFDARPSLGIEAPRERIGSERIRGGSRDVRLGLKNKLKNNKKRLGNRRKHDECYPESTSSVLDNSPQDSLLHPKVHKSGHQELTCMKKHISKFNEFGGRFDKELISFSSRRNMDKKTRLDLHTGGYINMLSDLRKLAEDDIKRTSWIVMKFEDLEEICIYLGENILELLLNHLTDELLDEFICQNKHN